MGVSQLLGDTTGLPPYQKVYAYMYMYAYAHEAIYIYLVDIIYDLPKPVGLRLLLERVRLQGHSFPSSFVVPSKFSFWCRAHELITPLYGVQSRREVGA